MVDQNRAGVDNEPTSEGAHGKRGDRNSPTTLNAGFHFAQFWDGRAKDLVEQAKGPVLNPVEMAMPDEKEVVKRLEADADYPKLFKAAFPGEDKPINYHNFARAVAAFERTLVTRDRFDDFLKGDDKALNAQELQGLSLFLTVGCTTCHVGPTIGGNMYQKIGVIHPYANTNDVGRIKVTGEEWDQYRFKVPSLRNVALTYPYFHDGQTGDLRSAVKQMAYMQLGKELTDNDISSLTAFLNSLSDKTRKAAN
jgi:cytochrome c peroxidase